MKGSNLPGKPAVTRQRCTIYTRKSTEEGLDRKPRTS
jgi:hypothetical protein